jgi:hypothetical protein
MWALCGLGDGSDWIMATEFSWTFPKRARGIRCFISFALSALLAGRAWAAHPDEFHVAVGYSGYAGDASAAQLLCGKSKLATAPLIIDVNGAQLTYSVTCSVYSGGPNIAIGSLGSQMKESLPKLIPDFKSPVSVPMNHEGFGQAAASVELSFAESSRLGIDLVYRLGHRPLGRLDIRVTPPIHHP